MAASLAKPLNTAPAMMMAMSSSISGRRPSLSAIGPPIAAPATAPNTSAAASKPWTCGPMAKRVTISGMATPSVKTAVPSIRVPPVARNHSQ